jgi:hypothetical protein
MLNSEQRNSQSRRPELHLTIVVTRDQQGAPNFTGVETKEHY